MPFALALLALPIASAGCTEVACFEWTTAEGACPSQDEAPVFFEEPFCQTSDIETVDSEGEFDDGACCYTVTKRDDSEYQGCFPGPSSGIAVTSGPTTVVASGGGFGGGMGGGSPSSSVSTGGGQGGSMGCIRCAEAISGDDPTTLCDDSIPIYESYMTCVCMGACMSVCTESCMAQQMMSMACQDCVGDTVSGCGNELSACANDL